MSMVMDFIIIYDHDIYILRRECCSNQVSLLSGFILPAFDLSYH